MSTQQEMIDDLCRQAEASYRSGDLQGARQIYEAVLQLDPGNEQALEGVALSSLTESHWSMVEKTGTGPAFAGALARARDLLATGDLEEARGIAGELLRQRPDDPEAQNLAAEIRQAIERAPRIAHGLADARAALARGDAPAAAEACRRVLALEAGHREAELLLEQAEIAAAPAAPPLPSAGIPLELDLDLALPARPGFAAPPPAAPAPPAFAPVPALAPAVRTAPQPVAAPARWSPPAAPAAVLEPPAADLLGTPVDPWDAPPIDPWATPAAEPDPFNLDEAAPTGPLTGRAQPGPPLGAADGPLFSESDFDGGRTTGPVPTRRELGDFLDAARDLNEPSPFDVPPQEEEAFSSGAGRSEGEAALLVGRAREEFEQGHLEDARQLAARALAISENAPGARGLLDEIQGVADRAAREAEDLLTQAIAEFERGRPDLAVPLLGQVLVLAPGHPEALDYLEKAEAARDQMGLIPGAVRPATHEIGGFTPDESAPAIPLQDLRPARPAPPPEPAAAPAWVPAPAPQPTAVPALGAGRAGAAAAPRKSAKAAPSRPRPAAATGSRSARAGLIALLAVLVLLGGGWYGWQWLAGDDASSDATVVTPPRRARPKPEAPAAAAPATAAPAPAAPVAPDAPQLVAQASAALESGDEAKAVELLTRARQLAPGDPQVLERLQRASAALAARQAFEGALAEVRESWAREDFVDALRLLYRLPEGQRPPQLNRWISDGWYNAGVQQLQIGELGKAREYFNSALELAPDDAGAKRNLEVARRYANVPRDDAYRVYVKSLAFRGMR